MADEKKSSVLNDTISKVKDAVTSDTVKNATATVINKISTKDWKSYLTKKNIIIGVVILVCLGAVGSFFDDEETSTQETTIAKKDEKVQQVKSVKQDSKQDLRGPKILGIQLGMNKEEVYNILSKKYKLNVTKKDMDKKDMWDSGVRDNATGLFHTFMDLYFANNILYSMSFKPEIFNTSSFDTDFLKRFLKEYKINFSEDDYEVTEDGSYDSYTNSYRETIYQTIKNREEGYQIRITGERLIAISFLQKASDIKFE